MTLDYDGHFDPRACDISPARLRRADRPGKTEFVAYSQRGPLKESLDPRSFTIATFALCGIPASAPAGPRRWRPSASETPSSERGQVSLRRRMLGVRRQRMPPTQAPSPAHILRVTETRIAALTANTSASINAGPVRP